MTNDPNAPATDADISGMDDWVLPDEFIEAGQHPDTAPNPNGDFSPPDVQIDVDAGGLGVFDINIPLPPY